MRTGSRQQVGEGLARNHPQGVVRGRGRAGPAARGFGGTGDPERHRVLRRGRAAIPAPAPTGPVGHGRRIATDVLTTRWPVRPGFPAPGWAGGLSERLRPARCGSGLRWVSWLDCGPAESGPHAASIRILPPRRWHGRLLMPAAYREDAAGSSRRGDTDVRSLAAHVLGAMILGEKPRGPRSGDVESHDGSRLHRPGAARRPRLSIPSAHSRASSCEREAGEGTGMAQPLQFRGQNVYPTPEPVAPKPRRRGHAARQPAGSERRDRPLRRSAGK